MELQLLTDEVWGTITRVAKQAKIGDVAVAYLGTGAHERLPLRRGSTLVIDAGESRVKCGMTDPSEIRYYIDRGVKVFHRGGLHAKVFVLDGIAIVGSANVSQHSEYVLDEAALLSDNRSVVAASRAYVQSLALERVTQAQVERLEAIYRPPKGGGGRTGGSNPGQRRPQKHSPLWIISEVELSALSAAEEERVERGRTRAEQEVGNPRKYGVSWVRWSGHNRFSDQVRKGDQVIQLYRSGEVVEVWPPCRVVHVGRRYSVSHGAGELSRRFVFFEEPVDCKPMSWGEFEQAARNEGITYLRPRSTRMISNEHDAEALRRLLPK